MELEEELRVVGNNLKSLEVSEEKVICLYSFACRWWRQQYLLLNRKNICQFISILITIWSRLNILTKKYWLWYSNRPTNAKRNTRTKSRPLPLVSRRFVSITQILFESFSIFNVSNSRWVKLWTNNRDIIVTKVPSSSRILR